MNDDRRPSLGWLIARFCHYYPGLYYSPHWPTRDHVVPFRVFVLMNACTTHLAAERELSQAHASAYGAVVAQGNKKATDTLNKYIRRLIRAAYPSDD